MDWDIFWLALLWGCNNLFMYQIGYKRAFAEAEKLAGEMFGEIPVPDVDAVYWKARYEELADDFDHAVGPQSFGKELGRKDGREEAA